MRHVLVWVALVLAVPIPGRAQPAPPAAAGTSVTEARDYVAAAAAGDLFERTAGELVLRHEGAPDGVQRFAQKMITDHHNMTVMLRSVAEGAGVRPGVPGRVPPRGVGAMFLVGLGRRFRLAQRTG